MVDTIQMVPGEDPGRDRRYLYATVAVCWSKEVDMVDSHGIMARSYAEAVGQALLDARAHYPPEDGYLKWDVEAYLLEREALEAGLRAYQDEDASRVTRPPTATLSPDEEQRLWEHEMAVGRD